MSISYNKLWKLLIDCNMNKSELRERAKISTNAIAKMKIKETEKRKSLRHNLCRS